MASTKLIAWARADHAMEEALLTTGGRARAAVQSMITLALQGGGGGGLSQEDRASLVAFRARSDVNEATPTATNWEPRPAGFGCVIAVGAEPAPVDAGLLDQRLDREDNGVVLGVTTFTGADDRPWPQPWTPEAIPAGGGASTLAGWGVLTTGVGGAAADYVATRYGGQAGDVEVLLSWRHVTASAAPRVVARSTTASLTPGGAVTVDLALDKVAARTWTAGVSTLVGEAAKSYTSGTVYRARVVVSGATVQARAWPASGSEPGSWDVEGSIAAAPASGYVGLGVAPTAAGAQKVEFDDVSVQVTGAVGGYGLNYGLNYGG